MSNVNAYIIPDNCGNAAVHYRALPFDRDDYMTRADDFYQGDAAAELLELHGITKPVAGIVYPVQWHDDLPVTPHDTMMMDLLTR